MKFLFGHEDENTAYLVEDYPWGFKLRTQQRHWVETKKGYGQRHVTQTLNPKNGKWCKPKKSTYAQIVVLFLEDETGYLRSYHYSIAYTGQEELDKFLSLVPYEKLTAFQQDQIKFARAVIKTRSHITYEVKPSTTGPVSLTGLINGDPAEKAKADAIEKEQEERKAKQAEVKKKIGQCLNYYCKKEGL